MSRVLLIGATLLLGAAAPVAAQAPVDFAAGSPVRVQFASESQAVEGSLVSADRETFVFRPSADFVGSAYRGTQGQVVEAQYKEVRSPRSRSTTPSARPPRRSASARDSSAPASVPWSVPSWLRSTAGSRTAS